MPTTAKSVTNRLGELVDSRQRWPSVEEGWDEFLTYLEDRMGIDIQGSVQRRSKDLQKARKHLESDQQGDLADWFAVFERREDVIVAFEKRFLVDV